MGKSSTPKILSFKEALKDSEDCNKRHLLLGNGFSIACRSDIFRYDKLFDQADFSTLSATARQAFTDLGTTDFERVIRVLRDAAVICTTYGVGAKVAKQLRADAEAIKELLVQTIAKSHPERPSDITDEEYAHCHAFLEPFDRVYTLNYDLLLYWSHMKREKVISDDGFRTSQDDIETFTESDYVVWEPGQSHGANTWFLHGALHVFDAQTEVRKYTWNRTGVRLIEQVRDALRKDYFPLFVAEGTSEEKLERIRHSDYLAKAYRSFAEITGCLFIYGHSLAENDEHFLKLIERGKLSRVFVGLYGKPDSNLNKRIVRRANAMTLARSSRPLKVGFYDTATAKVWRD